MGQPIGLHIASATGATDVRVALSDGDVTVAEVFGALGVPCQGTTIDGASVDPEVKATHVLAPGAVIVGPRTDEHPVSAQQRLHRHGFVHGPGDGPGGGPDRVHGSERCASAPTVEVAIVGGLDAGHLQQLTPGRYRLGVQTDANAVAATTSDGDPGWYLAVNASPTDRARPVDTVAKPWHRGAETIEVVITGDAALAMGHPIDPQAGVVGHVHRPPRRLAPDMTAPTPVDDMPAPVAEPAPLSWAAVLAPIPVALLMAVFFRPFFAVFAAMGPLVAIGRFVETRRRYRRDVGHRNNKIAELHAEIAASRAAFAQVEAHRRWISQPHVAELWRRARVHSRRLWERRPHVTGYLTFTVGVAPALLGAGDLDVGGTATTSATNQLDVLLAEPIVLRSVPHVADLAAERGIGFHGDRVSCLAMARSAVLQLATLHGPADMRIAVLSEADGLVEWDWLKWLPHVVPELVGPQADAIARKLHQGADTAPKVATSRQLGEICLVVVDDPAADTAALERAAKAAALDLRVVAVAPLPTQLPAACTSLVAASASLAEIVSPQSLGDPVLVCPTGITRETATAWARSLAPMSDPESEGFARLGSGPVGLLQLISFETSAILAERWAHRGSDQVPAAIVGTDDRGAALTLDLDRDGPHMLIAGTTGSGKSELLRTLVVSLASQCPPTELNFVLVDFKGGGAFDSCNDLPHIAGLITDLDEHLVERAITSLRAELQRREHLFRSLGVSDHRGAVNACSDPLPRLMIVVDEFAALASDYPDLMTAIVDLAARGRSLGMHLVLATQRPSGVVDQKIRANTNLRIALRVQDAFDSQDVVGVADAAQIDRASPGRAIVSIGGDRPFAMQSAYTAAPDRRTQRCTVTPHVLFEASRGDSSPLTEPEANTGQGPPATRTELEVLVEAIGDAASGYQASQLWSDPLPESLSWADLQRKLRVTSEGGSGAPQGIALGLVDTPEIQQQRPWYWDPDTGPLVLFGASARTCAHTLMSVACGLSSSPDDHAHLYVIDGDAGTMASVMELSSTGAYVSVHETDRIERTVGFFEQALDERRLGPASATTRLVLMIDNLASVLSRFDDLAAGSLIDRLAALARDGTAQRLHLVIASRTVRDVTHRLAQQIPNRVTAELSDPTAYLTLGLRARDLAPLPKMRAIDLATRRLVQLVEPPQPADLANDLADVESRPYRGHRDHDGAAPVAIGSFPVQLSISEIAVASLSGDELVVPLGIEAVDLATAALRLGPGDNALVASAPGRGRSQTLVTIARQIERGQLPVRLIRVAISGSPLGSHSLAGDCVDSDAELTAMVDAAAGRGERVMLLVDDAHQLDDELAATLGALLSAPRQTRRDRALNMVVASTIDHARSMRSWLTSLRSEQRGVLLGASAGDADLFKVPLTRLDGATRIAGRGHFVQRGQSVPVQIACTDS